MSIASTLIAHAIAEADGLINPIDADYPIDSGKPASKIVLKAHEAFKVGDVLFVKDRPKNRSPYRVITGFEDEMTVVSAVIDGPGNGNRKQRRAAWRRRQKVK